MIREATISDDTLFRYRLDRVWDARLPKVCWIMLNPSTADGLQDDHTVRKCIGFSSIWGYGSLVIVNLWAYRARDPKHLAREGWQEGPYNDVYISNAIYESQSVICAWGAEVRKCPAMKPRLWGIRQQIPTSKGPFRLKLLAGNIPGHPLTLAYKTPRVAYEF
jgi:hypothetical protein